MGSSNSRMGSDPLHPRASPRTKFSFTSLLCGTSFSDDPLLMEDQVTDVSASPSRLHDSVVDGNFQSLAKELPSIICSESDSSSSTFGNATSRQSSNGTIEEITVGSGSRNAETSNSRKCLSESKDLVPCQENGGCRPDEIHSGRITDQGIMSTKPLPFGSSSMDLDVGLAPTADIDGSMNQICPGRTPSGSISQQEPGDSSTSGTLPIGNQADEALGIRNANSNSLSASSNSSVTRQTLGDEPVQEAVPLSSRFITPIGRREWRNGSVLHVDVVSISSNILSSSTRDISNREARRNSRRLFWDAFSRRGSRRNDDSPSIFFSTENTDDLGSYDRWLLDFSSDIFDTGVGDDSGSLNSRNHGTNERRRHSRSEVWERLRSDLGENSSRTTLCASGLHPEGTCSCETFLLAEESGTRASISRIVMLAEALFEVLDEIHRQPVSLSLSMVSRPAPESVVNSFPLKSHKKTNRAQSGEDVEQCYICLAEYEEGDKIRVLPCRHEYHMSCVDKWLKEIHGVCPLCRGDVCEGIPDCSASSS